MSTAYQFTVTGMTCGHCERAVTQAVQALDPAAEVRIDRAANRVDVASTQQPGARASRRAWCGTTNRWACWPP